VKQRLTATPALVKAHVDLFVNHRAYTLQSMRPHPDRGRHYYYSPKEDDSGGPRLLTEQTFADHSEGRTCSSDTGEGSTFPASWIPLEPLCLWLCRTEYRSKSFARSSATRGLNQADVRETPTLATPSPSWTSYFAGSNCVFSRVSKEPCLSGRPRANRSMSKTSIKALAGRRTGGCKDIPVLRFVDGEKRFLLLLPGMWQHERVLVKRSSWSMTWRKA
jgi:hypothetical protein